MGRFLLTFLMTLIVSMGVANAEIKLTASNGMINDNFGESVAVDGDWAVIGAPGNGIFGTVYVFRRVAGNWVEHDSFVPVGATAGSEFGFSVDIRGDLAIGGAPSDSTVGGAYIFRRVGTAWSFETRIVASDRAGGDRFGESVTIDGDYAVVGAHQDDTDRGAAYAFMHNAGSWTEQAKIQAADAAAPAHFFGKSVSLDGTVVAIGRPSTAVPGAAYIFQRVGVAWNFVTSFLANDTDSISDDQFGTSVSLRGTEAVIGAPQRGTTVGNGKTYVYEDSGGWGFQNLLTASDGLSDDGFGTAVALFGNTIVVGAPHDDDGGASAGTGFVYTRNGAVWDERGKVVASDGFPGDEYGNNVAVSIDESFIGSHLHGSTEIDNGAVYVYDLAGQIVFSPDSTDFGSLLVGQLSALQTHTILNCGVDSVTVTGVSISNPADFALVDSNVYPLMLATNQSITVDAGFAPADSGATASDLIVVTSAGNAVAKLTGVGVIFVPAQANVCYATTGFTDGGRLFTINTATGAGTLVGQTAAAAMPGLALNTKGELYGADFDDFHRIDPQSGLSAILGTFAAETFEAIAFNASDVLYGLSFGGDLYTIDPVAVTANPLGSTGGSDFAGMAFDPTDGTLYASTGNGIDEIYTINIAGPTATLVGSTGLGSSIPDIHFDAAGILYASAGGGGGSLKGAESVSKMGSDLYMINKTTAAPTLVGSIGVPSVSGLTLATIVATGIDSDVPGLSDSHQLKQNSPNPFNPTTTIAFQTIARGRVELTVYNVLGQKVRTLVDKQLAAGPHDAQWNGRDDAGNPVSSGVYLYRLAITSDSGSFVTSRKMTLLK